MTNIEQIVAGLRQGCSAVKRERLVNVEAGQVLDLLDALQAQQERADQAEAQLAPPAPNPDDASDDGNK